MVIFADEDHHMRFITEVYKVAVDREIVVGTMRLSHKSKQCRTSGQQGKTGHQRKNKTSHKMHRR